MIRSAAVVAAIAAQVAMGFGSDSASAASIAPLDLNRIEAGAEQIVHVRCTGNEFQADPAVRVVTISHFVVLDRAKGAAGPTLTVRQAGGVLDNVAVDYHVPKFRVGEEYVLFMPPASKLGLASPVGLDQGTFGVSQGALGKEIGNGRDFADLMAGVDSAIVPPGMAARLKQPPAARGKVDLGDFMALMRAKGAKQ